MTTLTRLLAASAAGAVLAAAPAASAQTRFNLSAGPLERSLLAFAAQSRRQLLFDPQLTTGLQAGALSGVLMPEAALARLLAGTGIEASEPRPGVIILRRPVRSDPSTAGRLAPPSPAPSPTVGPAAEPVVAEVQVTGSLIRGVAAGPSPVVVLGRDELERSGRATVADALSLLPQTFSGSSTPQTALIGSDGLGTNFLASSGVNLRGLGADSTLVLVDGRRLPGAGARGDFADLGMIPTAAVSRVEVLLDGASALYGSDAVGGVINIILRTDFDGAETRLRAGGATQGGVGQDLLSQTFGRTWSTGRLVLSYEHEDRGRLAASDRRETGDADLRGLGGSDLRSFSSLPGNILVPNASGAYAPVYAIPTTADGRPLASDFRPGTANLENFRALGDILPAEARNSGYLHLAQDLSPRVHLDGDARYSRRDVDFAQPGQLSLFQVTRANPFFVSPTSASSEVVGYAFGEEEGPIRVHGDTETAAVSAGLAVELGRTWRVDAYADWAQETDHERTGNLVNTAFLNEALGNTADNPATPYSAARDGYFNPFGSGGANSAAVLGFIGSGTARTDTRSRVETADVKADGVLFTLPGGEVRAALGAQVRQEYFKTKTVTRQSGVNPTASGGTTFSREITAGFAELRVPLVGAANALPGVRSLELSLAGRIESYQDEGVVGDPKLGLVWSPAASLKIRASYGTSFRAPALPELFATQVLSPAILTEGANRILTLVRYGGDTALRPETATTWTSGVEWRPGRVPGLVVSANFFDIAYVDRIEQPVLENVGAALTDPSYAPFVQRIDPAHSAADLAEITALLARSTSASAGLFPASTYGAVVDARFVNAASLHVRGADFAAAYGRTVGPNRLDLSFTATWLADYARRLTPTAAETELAGVTGEPAALRVRTTGSWSRGAFGATVGLNYVGGSTPLTGPHVDSWTTVDGQLAWRPPAHGGLADGLQLALIATNLFDRGPPFYNSPNAVAYDPANADVVGRTLSLELTKRW